MRRRELLKSIICAPIAAALDIKAAKARPPVMEGEIGTIDDVRATWSQPREPGKTIKWRRYASPTAQTTPATELNALRDPTPVTFRDYGSHVRIRIDWLNK